MIPVDAEDPALCMGGGVIAAAAGEAAARFAPGVDIFEAAGAPKAEAPKPELIAEPELPDEIGRAHV